MLTNLAAGNFIGVFSCPFSMCVCVDDNAGINDCFRGGPAVQIVLFPVNNLVSTSIYVNAVCMKIANFIEYENH